MIFILLTFSMITSEFVSIGIHRIFPIFTIYILLLVIMMTNPEQPEKKEIL